MDTDTPPLPLHTCKLLQPHTTINRSYILIHFVAIVSLLYYRVSSLFGTTEVISIFPWVLMTVSELVFSFFWVLMQAFRWVLVTRSVFPERLPKDEKLPPIDVFICTADPMKEPTVGVMNTVISAMSLDYPTDKLSVYLSDDAGASITLFGIRQAFKFAKSWVPFCRFYGIKTRCPEAYFSESTDDKENSHQGTTTSKFMAHKEEIKLKYEAFKQSIEKAQESDEGGGYFSAQNHSAVVEVMEDNESENVDKNKFTMPLLVYVSREKRKSHPHHFKAGALNVLLRISGILSNAPYVLVLDCDMYCNDPTSARQAMCFHLDPQISQSLAFVQFPQDFHNISKNDIYNGFIQWVFKILFLGIDGLQGPVILGTGFYIKRESLFRSYTQEDRDLLPSKQCFGPSNEFTESLHRNDKSNAITCGEEARFLASCSYEKDTEWGKEIGFMYHSVVEDYFTGFRLQCKGWKSVYRNPSRPAFLGSVPTNLNDTLVQMTRWEAGLLQVGFSRFSPLIYGPPRMPILQSMCYAAFSLQPVGSLPLLCYAFIPQFCLLNGISLYPKVSNPWFSIFAIVYISSVLKYFLEVLMAGGSLVIWWNWYRIDMIRSVTAYFLAFLDVIMRWIGLKEIHFVPTNKVANEEEVQIYNKDVFDFQAATIYLLPLTTIVNLNIASFVVGLKRVIRDTSYDELFGQIFLSFIVVIIGYPIIEGMILRTDKGRVPTSITLSSVAIVVLIVSMGLCF